LSLQVQEFDRLIRIRDLETPGPTDWEEAFGILARARQIHKNETLPEAEVEEWANLYAYADATQNLSNPDVGVEENDPRWKTFGAPQQEPAESAAHLAPLGFALRSPLLDLREGGRDIRLFLSFSNSRDKAELIEDLLAAGRAGEPFFRFELSGTEGWQVPNGVEMAFGSYLKTGAGAAIGLATEEENLVVRTDGDIFTADVETQLLVNPAGKVFRLTYLGAENETRAEITELPGLQIVFEDGLTEGERQHSLIFPNDLLADALLISLHLNQQAAPIQALDPEHPDYALGQGLPVLKVLLEDIPAPDPEDPEGAPRYQKRYQLLRQLELAAVFLEVEARDLQQFRAQNDQQILDPTKPFEPFGDEPLKENALYFSHPEIAEKRLHSFRIDLDWMNVNPDLAAWYLDYDRVEQDAVTITEPSIQNNAAFKARLDLFDRRESISLGEFPLFDDTDANELHTLNIPDLPTQIEVSKEGYSYHSLEIPELETEEETVAGPEEVVEWPRYFRLELTENDFQHDRYDLLLSAQAFNQNTADLNLNPPYAPLLKTLRLSYSAHTEIPLRDNTTAAPLLHLHPFGFAPVQPPQNDAGHFLLPQYNEAGALYIGLEGVTPPSVIPVLFQMAEGSANPDLPRADIAWSVLKDSEWLPLGDANLISDATDGLIRTGIIRFRIPEGIQQEHSLLPSGRIWLRATVAQHADSVAD
ncbi:MAG: hypothetical protein AAF570_15050, partial [Bacteroidota bacterium]